MDSSSRSKHTGPEYNELDTYDREQVDKAVRSGCSRRDLLKIVSLTGLSVAAAQHVLVTGNQAMAQSPKKGGTVRFASNIHGPNDTLDPSLFSTSLDYCRGRATYNGLLQHADDLSVKPELAVSYEANKDATRWNFKIRKGVRFHDGSEMTAEDVVYSMNRHLGEDSTSTIKSVMKSVKEWRKTGKYECEAILQTPNADLPTLLGLFQTKIIKNGTKGGGIGTGPFKLEFFGPGNKSIHTRNEDYWREGAHLDSIELTAITDPLARVNSIMSGDMQLISAVEPNAFRQIESSEKAKLLSTKAAAQVDICCLRNTAPGSSIDFVRGMQYIQDRERIVKRILKGQGSIGNDQPIMAAHGADFCSELPQREYDPDKARFHLKKSGFSAAQIVVAPVAPGIEEVVLLAQANLAKIGFDLNVKKAPTDGYWGTVWRVEPINVSFWNMRPTALSQMAIQYGPEAAWNDTYWINERMGELLKLAQAELDPTRRHEMMCEMQTLIHNGSGMVTPAFSNTVDAVANNVMGIPKVPLGPLGALEWPEYAWLA